jgi:aspartyl protease family protein
VRRLAVLACLGAAAATAQPRGGANYIVYDGLRYSSAQLPAAARSPVPVPLPEYGEDEMRLVRAADGHYYVHGSVNGHPMIFMIDTGASTTAIPADMARNAGMRAGQVTTYHTAGGKIEGSVTENNRVIVGIMPFEGMNVAVMPSLQRPLLGTNVLRHFQITQTGNAMLLRINR